MSRYKCSSVFIVGSPRSGTSVLGWALASLPGCFGGWEFDLPGKLAEAVAQTHMVEDCLARPDLDFWRARIPSDKIFEALGSGVDRLIREETGCECWVDTSPGNAGGMLPLANLFPKALFVHVVRHPVEVVESALRSGFDFYGTESVASACAMWLTHVRLAKECAEFLPDRVLMVRHADLRADPDQVARRLGAFVGSDDWVIIRDFIVYNRINSSNPKSPVEEVIGGKNSKARKIRLTEAEKAYVVQQCGDLASEMGVM